MSSVTPELLNQYTANGDNVILLDVRSQNDYVQSHIDGATNVFIPNLMMRRLKKGNLSVASVIHCNDTKEQFSNLCKTHKIVLYDDNTTDLDRNPTSVITLLYKKLLADNCSTCFILGGFQAYNELFPEFCSQLNNNDAEPSAILGLRNLKIEEEAQNAGDASSTPNTTESDCNSMSSPFPVEVLPYLYLGNAKNSADLESLRCQGIRYILNVTPNLPNVYEDVDDITYKQIPINDHWSQNLSVYFPEAIEFIDRARIQKHGVLVHCLAGISRSVTVTVAYLMQKMSLSLNDAYDYVKKIKPNISPNFNFMGQLLDFERRLNGATDLHDCRCTEKCTCSLEKTSFFMTPTKSAPNYELEHVTMLQS